MERVLNEVGLQNFVPIFTEKGIDLETFKYIITVGNSRKIVMEETGLSLGQIAKIQAFIERKSGGNQER
jgi:hypothetical protein